MIFPFRTVFLLIQKTPLPYSRKNPQHFRPLRLTQVIRRHGLLAQLPGKSGEHRSTHGIPDPFRVEFQPQTQITGRERENDVQGYPRGCRIIRVLAPVSGDLRDGMLLEG